VWKVGHRVRQHESQAWKRPGPNNQPAPKKRANSLFNIKGGWSCFKQSPTPQGPYYEYSIIRNIRNEFLRFRTWLSFFFFLIIREACQSVLMRVLRP
jgi:hypothetical protein